MRPKALVPYVNRMINKLWRTPSIYLLVEVGQPQKMNALLTLFLFSVHWNVYLPALLLDGSTPKGNGTSKIDWPTRADFLGLGRKEPIAFGVEVNSALSWFVIFRSSRETGIYALFSAGFGKIWRVTFFQSL
jgi:hypothetical protein